VVLTERASPQRKHGPIFVPRKGYLIRFRRPDLTVQLVVAANAEIHGEHLLFLHSDGSLAALFLLEIVETWSETDL
jgi:hypothetical protein